MALLKRENVAPPDELTLAKQRLREAAERFPASTSAPGARWVRRHPVSAIVAAGTLGCLLGRSRRARKAVLRGVPKLVEIAAIRALDRALPAAETRD